MLRWDRRSGFTLLELVIVVLIISILAVISLAQFRKLVRTTYATEAIASVGAILMAESGFHQENERFTGTLADLPVEFNAVNFGYASTAGTDTFRVVATGTTGTVYDGIVVTGTVDSFGIRTVMVVIGLPLLAANSASPPLVLPPPTPPAAAGCAPPPPAC